MGVAVGLFRFGELGGEDKEGGFDVLGRGEMAEDAK